MSSHPDGKGTAVLEKLKAELPNAIPEQLVENEIQRYEARARRDEQAEIEKIVMEHARKATCNCVRDIAKALFARHFNTTWAKAGPPYGDGFDHAFLRWLDGDAVKP